MKKPTPLILFMWLAAHSYAQLDSIGHTSKISWASCPEYELHSMEGGATLTLDTSNRLATIELSNFVVNMEISEFMPMQFMEPDGSISECCTCVSPASSQLFISWKDGKLDSFVYEGSESDPSAPCMLICGLK